MVPSRAFSKIIGRLLVGVMLFSQFAVASYACPGLRPMGSMANGSAAKAMWLATVDADAVAVAVAAGAGMPPDCDQMDPDAPNLCAAHCQQGQQSADTAAVPAVSAGAPTLLYSIPLEPKLLLGFGRFFPALGVRLDAAPEPPHTILHCVFRL